jgi:hypothetical protein
MNSSPIQFYVRSFDSELKWIRKNFLTRNNAMGKFKYYYDNEDKYFSLNRKVGLFTHRIYTLRQREIVRIDNVPEILEGKSWEKMAMFHMAARILNG